MTEMLLLVLAFTDQFAMVSISFGARIASKRPNMHHWPPVRLASRSVGLAKSLCVIICMRLHIDWFFAIS